MTFTKHLRETFQSEFAGKKDANYDYSKLYRDRMIEFRKQDETVIRLDRPTNLSRAKNLGYKAKQGFVMVRVKVRKGSGMHTRPNRARRPKRMGVTKLTRRLNIQSMAEGKAARKYPNCEVMNSYWIGEDGKNKYFEIILIDVTHPVIKADRKINWIGEKQHKGRAFRGLTSAGKRHRGLRGKGRGSEKARPSQRAHDRKLK
ncbi:MAG: 50S ribosomal protein L15e [archaeon]|nr:50S ribosomal protein L15e [archaeon]